MCVQVKAELGVQSVHPVFQKCFEGVGNGTGPFPEAEFAELTNEYLVEKKVYRQRELRRGRVREDVTHRRAIDAPQHKQWYTLFKKVEGNRWAALVMLRLLRQSMLSTGVPLPWSQSASKDGKESKDADDEVQERQMVVDLTNEIDLTDKHLLEQLEAEFANRGFGQPSASNGSGSCSQLVAVKTEPTDDSDDSDASAAAKTPTKHKSGSRLRRRRKS